MFRNVTVCHVKCIYVNTILSVTQDFENKG
jgi:hypothetical protein